MSLDQVQDIVASGITTSYPTSETSSSTPRSSTSPPAAVSLKRKADHLTPFDPPLLASNPVLDSLFLIGPLLSSHPSLDLTSHCLSHDIIAR